MAQYRIRKPGVHTGFRILLDGRVVGETFTRADAEAWIRDLQRPPEEETDVQHQVARVA